MFVTTFAIGGGGIAFASSLIRARRGIGSGGLGLRRSSRRTRVGRGGNGSLSGKAKAGNSKNCNQETADIAIGGGN